MFNFLTQKNIRVFIFSLVLASSASATEPKDIEIIKNGEIIHVSELTTNGTFEGITTIFTIIYSNDIYQCLAYSDMMQFHWFKCMKPRI